jgi:hypothetical protein
MEPRAASDIDGQAERSKRAVSTFNILFKNKDDQFGTSAVDRPNA